MDKWTTEWFYYFLEKNSCALDISFLTNWQNRIRSSNSNPIQLGDCSYSGFCMNRSLSLVPTSVHFAPLLNKKLPDVRRKQLGKISELLNISNVAYSWHVLFCYDCRTKLLIRKYLAKCGCSFEVIKNTFLNLHLYHPFHFLHLCPLFFFCSVSG